MVIDYLDVPKHNKDVCQKVVIGRAIFFINGLTFFTYGSRVIRYLTQEYMLQCRINIIYTAVKYATNLYKMENLNLTTSIMYIEFKWMITHLLSINLSAAAKNDNSEAIECSIRTIKELFREVRSGLTFKIPP